MNILTKTNKLKINNNTDFQNQEKMEEKVCIKKNGLYKKHDI